MRGAGQPEPRQLTRGERNRRVHQITREERGHFRQGDVHRRQHHSQRIRVKHHRDVRRPGEMREEIGMPRPRKARQPERFLVDRRRGDRVHGVVLRVVHGANDRVVRSQASFGAQDAGAK